MRLPIVTGTALLLILGSPALLPAQTPPQPGQIASASEIPASFEAAIPETPGSSSTSRTTTIAHVEDPHDRTINRVWLASIFTVSAATSLDAATSWGKQEGNPLLASSNGTFGAKGVALKAGLGFATILPQILMRKHKDLLLTFSMGNFVEAAIFAGVATHNLSIAAPKTSPSQ